MITCKIKQDNNENEKICIITMFVILTIFKIYN